MALTSNGLTDIGQGAGFTTNFQVQYDDTLLIVSNAQAVANALLNVIENEFAVTIEWFNVDTSKFGTGQRVNVRIEYLSNDSDSFRKDPTKSKDGWGAINWGYPDNTICIDPQNNNVNEGDAEEIVKMLFMAEWVEILMSAQGKWNAGDSSGEALSHYCGIIRFPTGHNNYYRSFVDTWLNSPPREDWVTKTYTGGTKKDSTGKELKGDQDPVSYGCALAFIFYLNVQLGFDIKSIIAAAAPTLAGIYKNLTQDTLDPTPDFIQIMNAAFPPNNPDGSIQLSTIPGPNFDNPFPLPSIHTLSTLRYFDNILNGQLRSIRMLLTISGKQTLRPALNCNRRVSIQ